MVIEERKQPLLILRKFATELFSPRVISESFLPEWYLPTVMRHFCDHCALRYLCPDYRQQCRAVKGSRRGDKKGLEEDGINLFKCGGKVANS